MKKPIDPRPCQTCGQTYQPATTRQRFCGAPCRDRFWNRSKADARKAVGPETE